MGLAEPGEEVKQETVGSGVERWPTGQAVETGSTEQRQGQHGTDQHGGHSRGL